MPFLAAEPGEAARWLTRAARDGSTAHVHLLNAYSLVLAHRSADFRSAVTNDAINFADGKPISWFSGSRKTIQQVRGPALFEATFRDGVEKDIKHLLIGSTPETLDRLTRGLTERHPGAKIVGAISPPYRVLSETERAQQDAAVRESGADIVWVGLGTPKQDLECARIANTTGKLVVAIGAAFDFSAGTKKEAPTWVSTVGLEWLFRLASEPRRLWRRYLLGNLQFLALVLRYRRAKSD